MDIFSDMNMKDIQWGIVGCGNVCEVKSGPGLQAASGSALEMVMRRDASKAQDYAIRHQVPRWTDIAGTLINDPGLDAVYIATPPDSHHPYTLAAAAAGKAVYVEKPMALSTRECQEMIAACEGAKVPLFVAYYRRALPRFLQIKDFLNKGSLGEIQGVHWIYRRKLSEAEKSGDTRNWRVFPNISGGGHFVDLASHALDLLQFLLGNLQAVDGRGENRAGAYPAEDWVEADLSFPNGLVGGLQFQAAGEDYLDQLEIKGRFGLLRFSVFGDSIVEFKDIRGQRKSWLLANPLHIQSPLIQTVVDSLHGRGACPSTGRSAVFSTWAMESILASYYDRPLPDYPEP